MRCRNNVPAAGTNAAAGLTSMCQTTSVFYQCLMLLERSLPLERITAADAQQ